MIGEEAAFTGKEGSSALRVSKFPLHQGLHVLIPLFRIPFHLINVLILTVDHLPCWEMNLCCNPATSRMRFWAWFSEISALQL